MSAIPSRTSIWAAAARAIGSRFEHPRNPDHLADVLIGPAERALLEEHALARVLEHDTPENRRQGEVQSAAMTLIVRTKFVDECLLRALADGAQQVVIMGAGWDTRAWRFERELADAQLFEVDQADTQNWKRQRVEEAIGRTPTNHQYLTIDFRAETLDRVLSQGGYDRGRKTLFIWEGVTMYLPEPAVRSTLTWIAQQAPGSSVVFDYAHAELIAFIAQILSGFMPENEQARIGAERIKQISAWGEPWIFGLPGGDAAAFLHELGLTHRQSFGMGSQEAARRFLGWDKDEPFPAAIRQFYSICEGAVARK
jgi:methyltransferase (TIGR00027 family)